MSWGSRYVAPLGRAAVGGVAVLTVIGTAVAGLAVTHIATPTTTWAALGSVATIATAIVAIWTLVALKQDSADRTRPVMVAELVPAVLTSDAELIVRNAGRSVARNVKVDFDPPLPILEGSAADGLVTPFLQQRYSRTIPTIAPGMSMFNSYKDATDDDEPVPDDLTITFHYSDTHGRRYSDSYELAMRTLHGHTAAYPANDDAPGMQRRLVKAVEAIARAVGRH